MKNMKKQHKTQITISCVFTSPNEFAQTCLLDILLRMKRVLHNELK